MMLVLEYGDAVAATCAAFTFATSIMATSLVGWQGDEREPLLPADAGVSELVPAAMDIETSLDCGSDACEGRVINPRPSACASRPAARAATVATGGGNVSDGGSSKSSFSSPRDASYRFASLGELSCDAGCELQTRCWLAGTGAMAPEAGCEAVNDSPGNSKPQRALLE
jgi:hypothetical protein